MKRLVIAAFVVMGGLSVAPAASAEGAFHAECTRFRPGTIGGEIIITPSGNILLNCRYPGPAEGGGAEHLAGVECVITPAGNFQCR